MAFHEFSRRVLPKNGSHGKAGVNVRWISCVRIPSRVVRSGASLGPRSQIVVVRAVHQRCLKSKFFFSGKYPATWVIYGGVVTHGLCGTRTAAVSSIVVSAEAVVTRIIPHAPYPTHLGRADFGRHVRAPETQLRRRTCALLVDRQSF